MGTHPIFESDFDCLQVQTSFVLRLKSCVTSLLTFWLNLAVMTPPLLTTSRLSFPALASTPTKRSFPSWSPSFRARTSTKLSPRAKKSSHPFQLAVPPLVELLLEVLLLRKPRKRPRPALRRNPETTIWDSVSSIKNENGNRPL